ncbi:IclR family transcriptional regulator [Sinomonas humi]|uniref:IclR family transcriptional regulator n=1 Tax=Sinomonas humi TaxID=1338436 RepID=A0A0B2AHR8_9MICC|nr:IclR family transcriptional regulator [Sinomonas humi]KHL01371.1 IclR family transcriptional regulator [Sinomonas humi]
MIDRVVEILEAFKTAGSPLTASEIARRTRLPMASAHRLVAEMVRTGILTKDENNKLSIGMRLWEITARSSTLRILRESALPYMEEVMTTVCAPTLLCVLDGNDVVNVETLMPRGPAATNVTQPGVRLPALASSPGIALLAFADPPTCAEVLATAKAIRFTPYTPVDLAVIRKLIDEAKRLGRAVAPRWMSSDSTGIAVPVLGGDGRAVASLSVTLPVGSVDLDAIVPTLRAAARGISRAAQSGGETANPRLALLKHQLRRATEGR